jgi:hypothetical protein
MDAMALSPPPPHPDRRMPPARKRNTRAWTRLRFIDSPPAILSFGNNPMTGGVLPKMRAQIAGARGVKEGPYSKWISNRKILFLVKIKE